MRPRPDAGRTSCRWIAGLSVHFPGYKRYNYIVNTLFTRYALNQVRNHAPAGAKLPVPTRLFKGAYVRMVPKLKSHFGTHFPAGSSLTVSIFQQDLQPPQSI